MPQPDSELGQWFATRVQPHEPVLRAWLRSRFRTEDDLDDLVPESSLRLLRARERGEVTSPKAFLFTVARNRGPDRCRHGDATERHRRRWGDSTALAQCCPARHRAKSRSLRSSP